MTRSWTSRLAATIVVSHLLAPSVYAQVAAPSSIASSIPIVASTATPIASVITSALASISPSPSSSSTASRGPKVFTVTAGVGGFKFTPNSVSNVSVNDVITFEFFPPDHSVARAEFGSACVPYEYTGKNKTGFWSTTQWVNNTNEITHWNLTINSTEPIFFYCAAPKSCTGQHMVGVINPNDTQTLDAQIKAAETADFQVEPGQPIPAEASSTLVNAPTVTATASSTPVANNSGSHKLSGGAIAGIVVGSVAFLAVCAALFFFIGRSKSLKEVLHHRDGAGKPATPDPHMSQYGHGGLGSPGFPSPQQQQYATPGQGDYGYASPPMYGQHAVGEQYPSRWGTPPPQHAQQHASMMSGTSGLSQQQIDELKYAQTGVQPALAELHSPTPGQQEFPAELEVAHQGQK